MGSRKGESALGEGISFHSVQAHTSGVVSSAKDDFYPTIHAVRTGGRHLRRFEGHEQIRFRLEGGDESAVPFLGGTGHHRSA
jgi:hypothetical protein